MTKSVTNFVDLTEDEKLHIFMLKENVQVFSKYMCNIYEWDKRKYLYNYISQYFTQAVMPPLVYNQFL